MKRLIALLAALLLISALPVGAHDPGDELSEVEAEIHRLNEEIAANKVDLTGIAAELAAAEARMIEIRGQIAEVQGRVDGVQLQIDGRELELADLRSQLDDLARELAETRIELRSSRSQIRDRAVELYMGETSGLGGLLMGFGDVSEVAVGMEYAENVLDSMTLLLNSLEILQIQEERQQTEIESRTEGVESIVAQLEGQKAGLEVDLAQMAELEAERQSELDGQAALLASVRRAIDEFEHAKAGLEDDARRLKAEIAARAAAGGQRPGSLLWPVNGAVTSGFGWRTHPILGGKRLHAGIDISASTGQRISAAGNGRVILAETYGGYGRAVVIDHGGGLTTLYAHMSSISVSFGQQVLAGDKVGEVGCSGYCTGPHLHFETRESGEPVDPMKYLG